MSAELDALLFMDEMLLFHKELSNWSEYDTFVALNSKEEEKVLIEEINREENALKDDTDRDNRDREGTSGSINTEDTFDYYFRGFEDVERTEDGY